MPSLLLGAFEMIATDGSAKVMAEGTSWGAPVSIEVAVNTFLQDGAIVVTQGHDNREVNVTVRFYGTDLTALNAKEAALFAELEQPNTLTWTPGGGQPATVFVVVTSSLAQNDESFVGEFQARPWRTYSIRLVCEAFPRSLAEVTTASLPATGSTTTLLDACSATTGWTGTVDGGAVSPATSGGAVTLTASVSGGTHAFVLQKTFAATTTSTKYLVIDWRPPSGVRFSSLAATGDGVSLPLLFEGPSPTSGYIRSMFQVAASSLAVTKLSWAGQFQVLGGVTVSAVLSIDNVGVSNVNPIFGTGRQQARSLTVSGSARTQGALAVESATAALGDALVYVYPSDASTNGYSPPLRQFRAVGNTVTADAAQVSGSTEPVNGVNHISMIVPSGLFPAGSYVLMGRLALSGGGTATVNYNSATAVGGFGVATAPTVSVSLTMTTAYSIFALGRLQLPIADTDPAARNTTTLQLTISTASTCTYDEFWLFNTTIGSLVWVDCGTGAGSVGGFARRLFIEPPTVTTPRPTVRIGHSADRSDAFFPQTLKSWQFPEFKPPQVNVFAVTPGATDATVTLRNFPRWHTNPAS